MTNSTTPPTEASLASRIETEGEEPVAWREVLQAMLDHYGPPASVADMCEYDHDHRRLIERLRAAYTAWNNPPSDGLPGGAGVVLEAADELSRLRVERDRCHARLEIDHHFVMVGDDKLERREIPLEDRANEVDGIEARDCTIAIQDEQIARLRGREEEYRKALETALVAMKLAAALPGVADEYDFAPAIEAAASAISPTKQKGDQDGGKPHGGGL